MHIVKLLIKFEKNRIIKSILILKKNSIYTLFAIILLVLLLSSVIKRSLEKKATEVANLLTAPKILGLMNNFSPDSHHMEGIIKESVASAKGMLNQKTLEVKENFLKSVENEVSDLTQSQIHSLKYQICSEWGLVSPAPSQQP